MNSMSTPPPRFLASKLGRLTASAAIGLGSVLLLTPQPASALDVNFSFGGVEGLIQGLTETGFGNFGNFSFPSLVRVTSAPSLGLLGDYTVSPPLPAGGPNGFTVVGGLPVTEFGNAVTWVGTNSNGDLLSFLNLNPGTPACGYGINPQNCGPYTGKLDFAAGGGIQGPVQFDSTPVPGPLPVLGAAAAFGYSRKLRKRIRGSRSVANTAPNA
jgi:hypothetical protein